MSKLARYKKPPVVKLPPPKKPSSRVKEVRSDSNDDDDFQSPIPPSPIKYQEPLVTVVNKKPAVKASTKKTVSKQRGRKFNINIMELPLFQSSDIQKKENIERRINTILDEEIENHLQRTDEPNVREIPNIKALGVPRRLQVFSKADAPLWNLSSSEVSTCENFVTAAVLDFKSTSSTTTVDEPKTKKVSHPIVQSIKTSPIPPIKVKSSESSLKTDTEEESALPRNTSSTQLKLISDLLRMFVNKDDTDLTVYGREEKPIKCHKLIVKARCRKLYDEIVNETNVKGVDRQVIALTCYSHLAVKAFIKFLYWGRLKDDLEKRVREEVEELGVQYGILLPESETIFPNVDVITSVADPVSTVIQDSEEMFPSVNLESHCNTSVDLFDDEPDLQIQQDERKDNASSTIVNDEKNQMPAEDEVLSEAGSRDLFEDFEYFNDDFDQQEEKENVPNITTTTRNILNGDGDDIDLQLENELASQVGSEYKVHLSPKPHTHKRSRSRSRSPLIFTSSQPYTASQMAEYIDFIAEESQGHKAIKKHKLDLDNDNPIVRSDDDNEVIIISSNLAQKSFRIVNDLRRKDVKSKCQVDLKLGSKELKNSGNATKYVNTSSQFSSTPVNNSGQSRLYIPNPPPSISPVQTFEDDPFAAGEDDSYFLNLPSILMQGDIKTPTSQVNSITIRPRQIILSPTPTVENVKDSTVSEIVNNKNKKGGRKKRTRALSQEATPTHKNTTVPTKTMGPNGMDYSTIDTPILKKELKRFGLKPLPRSKAKLILRHIIEETNKNNV